MLNDKKQLSQAIIALNVLFDDLPLEHSARTSLQKLRQLCVDYLSNPPKQNVLSDKEFEYFSKYNLRLTDKDIDDFNHVVQIYKYANSTSNQYLRNESRAMAGDFILKILLNEGW